MNARFWISRFSPARQFLIGVAFISAFACIPFLVSDCLTGHTFTRTRFLTRFDAPWDIIIPFGLTVLFADLLVELWRSSFAKGQSWSGYKHATLVILVWVATLFALLVFYLVAVQKMVGPIPEGSD